MRSVLCVALLFSATCVEGRDASLTIYNQDFAVVRGTLSLDLRDGVNEVHFNDTTASVEPSSVVLRDASGNSLLQVLEQNYRSDPVTQALMLSLFEGQTIDFRVQEDHKSIIVRGKVIRSGYDRTHGQSTTELQPIVEVDGKLRFELPGVPLFPALADDTILKPELNWRITTNQPGHTEAEVSYVTNKINWTADYNVVAAQNSDMIDVVGWVTIDNRSGKKFEETRTKLVAGEVNKVQPTPTPSEASTERVIVTGSYIPVTEKPFDDYHLYTLPRPITLRDKETKQIEFARGANIQSTRLYMYDSSGAPFGQAFPIPENADVDRGAETGWDKRVP